MFVMANQPPVTLYLGTLTKAGSAVLDAWGGSGWKNRVFLKATDAPILTVNFQEYVSVSTAESASCTPYRELTVVQCTRTMLQSLGSYLKIEVTEQCCSYISVDHLHIASIAERSK